MDGCDKHKNIKTLLSSQAFVVDVFSGDMVVRKCFYILHKPPFFKFSFTFKLGSFNREVVSLEVSRHFGKAISK